MKNIRKKPSLLVLISFIAYCPFLVLSCFGPWGDGEQGTIIIALGSGGNSRYMMNYPPEKNMDKLSYEITLYRIDPEQYQADGYINIEKVFDIISKSFSPPYANDVVRFAIPVTPGTWAISVEAFWYRFPYASSEGGTESPKAVQVTAGSQTPARIQMEGSYNWPNWITISSADELMRIGDSKYPEYPLYGNYLLIEDITIISGWTPIGKDQTTNLFKGTFDGNGKTITMNIETTDSSNYGLFGFLEGTVSNLRLKGLIYLTNASNSIGAVAAYINGGKISNVSSSVSINVSANENDVLYVGGIAGYMNGGIIEHCYTTGDIVENSTLANASNCGGIVGYQSNGSVSYCWVSGKIDARAKEGRAGGIVGNLFSSTGAIDHCVALNGNGNVSGNNNESAHRIIGSCTGPSVSSSTNYANFDSPSNSDDLNLNGNDATQDEVNTQDWWNKFDTVNWNVQTIKTEATDYFPWWWNSRPILWFEDTVNE